MSERYRRGEVFWAPDPFNEGANPRPWLVIANESLPYPDEEYFCLALTTSNLPENYHVGESWVSGGNTNTESFCSPWVAATVKHDEVDGPQGRVTEEFADKMAEECGGYL